MANLTYFDALPFYIFLPIQGHFELKNQHETKESNKTLKFDSQCQKKQ